MDPRIDMEFIFGLADLGDDCALDGQFGHAVSFYTKAAQLWTAYESSLAQELGYETGWAERLEGKRMLAALLKDGGLIRLAVPSTVKLDEGSLA